MGTSLDFVYLGYWDIGLILVVVNLDKGLGRNQTKGDMKDIIQEQGNNLS